MSGSTKNPCPQPHSHEANCTAVTLSRHIINMLCGVLSRSDGWDEREQAEYFSHALPMLDNSNSDVNSGNNLGNTNGSSSSDSGDGGGSGGGVAGTSSHETHRGRPLGNPFVAARLCEQFPTLQLTLDASHWMLVCERLLGSSSSSSSNAKEKAVLELVVGRTAHVHARVGTVEAAQLGVPPPGSTRLEQASTEAHEQLWLAVWDAQRAAGRAATTITPEYGPAPYMPLVPGSMAPANDVWQQTEAAADRLRLLFRQST